MSCLEGPDPRNCRPGSFLPNRAEPPSELAESAHFDESEHQFLRILIDKGIPLKSLRLIGLAYGLAESSHDSEVRASGGPYFEHLRATALILVEECGLQNCSLICAALLHDLVENIPTFKDSSASDAEDRQKAREYLEPLFGKQTVDIVLAVTKPRARDDLARDERTIIALELLRSGPDQAVILKMADRLHNLRTLAALPLDKQMHIVEETEKYYLPLFEKFAARKDSGLEDPARYLLSQIHSELRNIRANWAQ